MAVSGLCVPRSDLQTRETARGASIIGAVPERVLPEVWVPEMLGRMKRKESV